MKILNKKYLIALSLFLNFGLMGWFGYTYFFKKDNSKYFDFIRESKDLPSANGKNISVCFVGNSITANWVNLNHDFFKVNDFLNNGIGGQSSTQILLRFQHDIINNDPDIVILNTGINDIGENDGFYREWFTLNNIQSMIDICKANDIKIILTSVLPATEVKLNRFKSVDNLHEKINSLNSKLYQMSVDNSLIYVDYFNRLVDKNGNFNEKYTFDGVHPNEEGYKIMEEIILEVLYNIDNNKE